MHLDPEQRVGIYILSNFHAQVETEDEAVRQHAHSLRERMAIPQSAVSSNGDDVAFDVDGLDAELTSDDVAFLHEAAKTRRMALQDRGMDAPGYVRAVEGLPYPSPLATLSADLSSLSVDVGWAVAVGLAFALGVLLGMVI